MPLYLHPLRFTGQASYASIPKLARKMVAPLAWVGLTPTHKTGF